MNSPWRIFGLEAFKERNLKDKAIRPTVCSFLSTELSERFLADYWLFSWNIMYSVPAALVPCNNANGSLSNMGNVGFGAGKRRAYVINDGWKSATLWYTDPLGYENKTTWDCMCLKVFIFGMPIRLELHL